MKILFSVVSKIINRYLQLDTNHQNLLKPLQDKTIIFKVSQPSINFMLTFTNQQIQIESQLISNADATISGTAAAFIQAQRSTSPSKSNKLTIEGDVETIQAFYDLLSGIDIDWEEQLSKISGDVFAYNAFGVARNFKRWLSDAQIAIQQTLSNYLQEEKQVIPSKKEVDAFAKEVREMSYSVERLEAKLKS